MPTYEYRCEACDHELEEFQSMTAKPLRKCPACGKMKLKRLIGVGAGIIFKGSGFYETDYGRSSDYKDKAKAEKDGGTKKDDTKSDSSSDSSSSTKTETKAESKPASRSSDSGSNGKSDTSKKKSE